MKQYTSNDQTAKLIELGFEKPKSEVECDLPKAAVENAERRLKEPRDFAVNDLAAYDNGLTIGFKDGAQWMYKKSISVFFDFLARENTQFFSVVSTLEFGNRLGNSFVQDIPFLKELEQKILEQLEIDGPLDESEARLANSYNEICQEIANNQHSLNIDNYE